MRCSSLFVVVVCVLTLGGCSDDTKAAPDSSKPREASTPDLQRREATTADGPRADGPTTKTDGAKPKTDGPKNDATKPKDGATGSACAAAGGQCVTPAPCSGCGTGKEPSSDLYSDCPSPKYCCVPVTPSGNCGLNGFCVPTGTTCPTGLSPQSSMTCSAGRICCAGPC